MRTHLDMTNKTKNKKIETYEKIINFEPGYDYIYGIPKKDDRYGRHGMNIRFVLIGEKGAVQFLMFTNWLPMVKKVEGRYEPTFNFPDMTPMAVDIGYHSPKPMYKGQKKIKECSYIKGGCYYDGSGIASEEYMATLINKGQDALWKKMKRYYKETFKT